ncbi:MAG: hypothetical protein IPL50_15820 [Chitinophagaceae bacterium]|nr:hypothetical protein [Chitinophagaceae bacterium]
MINMRLFIFIFFVAFFCLQKTVGAQENPGRADTFFLAKKKGLLGRFGKSIATTPPDEAPVKLVNPYLQFKGLIIRSIETIRLGFEYDIDDTTHIKNNFGTKVGKALHKNTTDKVIKRNLFFNEGDQLFPYLLADNERYLRELIFIKDARILVDFAEGSADSVDVIVLTKDVFSIGGNFSFSGTNRARLRLRDENLLGSGTKLQLGGYYEKERFPVGGFSAELARRNIGGSFIDWVSGYSDFNEAFTSGRKQETVIYTRIEKPLITPYIPSTGALEWSYLRTRNVYDNDSVYGSDVKYAYYKIDAWFGYSLDSKKSLYANKEIKVHRFVAIRGFKQKFLSVPSLYKTASDYRFKDITGILASLNIFRQLFYKTNFVYGFGRKEDIPEGFSVVFTGGYVMTQNIKRPYSGLDLSLANIKKRGLYFNYTFRAGAYYHQKRFEDIDLLFNVEHFTRLKRMSQTWYQRTFINTGIAVQANPFLNSPLFLNSDFGFRYFNNSTYNSDIRMTLKTESVFYNTKKILGFRLAPFVFGDIILMKPTKQGLIKTDIFSAIGAGVRTRNENLIWGTIELKAYYFPRVVENMRPWKIELKSNIRFRFISRFINRPDFIVVN